MTTIALTPIATHGPELVGRAPGARLREEAVGLAATARVVIDLAGIEAMSPSFADEIFGKLPADLIRDRRIRFANASDEIRALARGVRGNRARLVPA
ncbi:MAG TPA: STAS-like domain-containing protein [Miltoncostaeaceae bacterium]|nr:STAS-like domain-containing protein [Miltoncostaeaceae bacterium]